MAITWVYLLKMGIFHGELLNSQRVYVLSKLINPVLGQFFDSFANPAAMKKGGSRVAAGLAGQPHQHPRSTMVYRIDFTCLIKNQGWSRVFFWNRILWWVTPVVNSKPVLLFSHFFQCELVWYAWAGGFDMFAFCSEPPTAYNHMTKEDLTIEPHMKTAVFYHLAHGLYRWF